MGNTLMRVVAALASAALLVVVASVVFVARPGTGLPRGGASSAPTSASPAPVTPSAAASAPETGALASAPASSSFQAASATFISSTEGWVLGSAPCASGTCATILHTDDGGNTWVSLPAPTTPLADPLVPVTEDAVGSGVGGLRFADAQDGWAFGPDLWATHDGGATWRRVTIPGAATAPVVALETSGGSVQAILYQSDAPAARIATSPVDSDHWTLSALRVSLGAGPQPSSQLVLAGTSGWLLQVDRTVVGGALLAHGAWADWTPPCADVQGPAVLAASSPSDLAAACTGGVWGPAPAGEAGERLYLSSDGGATFRKAETAVPLDQLAAIAFPDPAVVIVGGTKAQSSAIVGSFDGGGSWQTLLTMGQPGGPAAVLTYLGFTTSQQGVAITQSGTGTGGRTGQGILWLTRDGGHTWAKVAFSGG